MKKTKKFLRKLPIEQQAEIESLIGQLHTGNWFGLNVKKLKISGDLFRLRYGKIRIIFRQRLGEELEVLRLGWRDENTYKF